MKMYGCQGRNRNFFEVNKIKDYTTDDVDFSKLGAKSGFDMISDLIIATGEESPPMVLTLVDGTIISGSFYSYDGKYISLLGYYLTSENRIQYNDSIIVVGLERILYFETKKTANFS